MYYVGPSGPKEVLSTEQPKNSENINIHPQEKGAVFHLIFKFNFSSPPPPPPISFKSTKKRPVQNCGSIRQSDNPQTP